MFDQLQNQDMRITTEAMRTMPIQEPEQIIGLQPMEDIKDSRAQKQEAKLMRLESRPVHKRVKR